MKESFLLKEKNCIFGLQPSAYPIKYMINNQITDEKALIAEVKRGSEDSFKMLYKLWVSRLYGFVYHYVKSESTTDDIVQETFVRIWTHRETLNSDYSFKAYLFTISYRLLLKELRHQLNNPLVEEFVDYQNQLATPANEAERKMEFDHFIIALEKAKSTLSPRQREIFEMNKELNYSIAEIAEKLNITEQVVRNQLSASLKVIRGELQQYIPLLLLFLMDF